MFAVRFIEQADLPHVLAAERALHTVRVSDPDFGRFNALNPWAVGREGLLRLVRQRKRGAERETRALVAHEPGRDACGCFVYEKHADRLEVVWLSARPGRRFEPAVSAMLVWLKNKAAAKGRSVVYRLRDRDEAGIRVLLPLFRRHGFSVRLEPDAFGHCDGWLCTFSR